MYYVRVISNKIVQFLQFVWNHEIFKDVYI
jgi:hypothetical protein